MQTDLNGVSTWCKYHKLSINTNKTKAMYFGVKQATDVANVDIEISNNRIEFVITYKYLGIHLDSTTSLKKHID